jgi:inosine-uridine nucleoside N-ribohydrolase
MKQFNIPREKKSRVIIDTDAKNEVDDQFAIVHALLSESMDIQALIAAQFGTEKSAASMQDSCEEILKVLHLLNRDGTVPVLHGAEKAMASEEETAESEGAVYRTGNHERGQQAALYRIPRTADRYGGSAEDGTENCGERRHSNLDWRQRLACGRMGI